jgi:hypothetical protein
VCLKFNRKYLLVASLILLVFFISGSLSAQCAMCKQAAESSLRSNPNSLARSLNSGILYLMAVPYVLIGFIFRKQLAQLFRKVRGRILRTKPADQLP